MIRSIRPIVRAVSRVASPVAKTHTPRFFHTSRPLQMSQPFLDAIQKRRTFYSISPQLPAGMF